MAAAVGGGHHRVRTRCQQYTQLEHGVCSARTKSGHRRRSASADVLTAAVNAVTILASEVLEIKKCALHYEIVRNFC